MDENIMKPGDKDHLMGENIMKPGDKDPKMEKVISAVFDKIYNNEKYKLEGWKVRFPGKPKKIYKPHEYILKIGNKIFKDYWTPPKEQNESKNR